MRVWCKLKDIHASRKPATFPFLPVLRTRVPTPVCLFGKRSLLSAIDLVGNAAKDPIWRQHTKECHHIVSATDGRDITSPLLG